VALRLDGEEFGEFLYLRLEMCMCMCTMCM
jgi:hypothetical protein